MNETKELAVITKKLACFSRQAIPLHEAINNIEGDIKNKKLRDNFDKLSLVLKSGKSLSDALDDSPPIYPVHIKKIIQGGEKKGEIAETLEQISSYLVDEEILGASVCGRGIIMPVVLYLNIFTALLILIVFFILPTFVELFEGINLVLPLPTRMIMALTVFLHIPGILPAIIVLLLAVDTCVFLLNPVKNSLLYNLPVTGSLLKKYYSFQIASTGGMMLEKGISPEEAFLHLSRGITMGPVKKSLNTIYEQLKSGDKLHTIFEVPKFFPDIFCFIMAKGERDGNLPEAMNKGACIFKEDLLKLEIKDITQPGPVFVIIMGSIAGFIVISLFMPLYQVMGTIR